MQVISFCDFFWNIYVWICWHRCVLLQFSVDIAVFCGFRFHRFFSLFLGTIQHDRCFCFGLWLPWRRKNPYHCWPVSHVFFPSLHILQILRLLRPFVFDSCCNWWAPCNLLRLRRHDNDCNDHSGEKGTATDWDELDTCTVDGQVSSLPHRHHFTQNHCRFTSRFFNQYGRIVHFWVGWVFLFVCLLFFSCWFYTQFTVFCLTRQKLKVERHFALWASA